MNYLFKYINVLLCVFIISSLYIILLRDIDVDYKYILIFIDIILIALYYNIQQLRKEFMFHKFQMHILNKLNNYAFEVNEDILEVTSDKCINYLWYRRLWSLTYSDFCKINRDPIKILYQIYIDINKKLKDYDAAKKDIEILIYIKSNSDNDKFMRVSRIINAAYFQKTVEFFKVYEKRESKIR